MRLMLVFADVVDDAELPVLEEPQAVIAAAVTSTTATANPTRRYVFTDFVTPRLPTRQPAAEAPRATARVTENRCGKRARMLEQHTPGKPTHESNRVKAPRYLTRNALETDGWSWN